MKRLGLSFAVLVAALHGASAPTQEKPESIDLSRPLPTVVLGDGRTLHNLTIVSFGGATIMARWEGGRGTIAYSVLPDEIRRAAERSKPAPPEAPTPDGPKIGQTGPGAQTPKGFPLTLARRGYATHLLRREATNEPPDQPPRGVLNLASYPGPLGAMAAYVSPRPKDGKRHPAIIWLVGGSSNSISSVAWEPASPDDDQSASEFRKLGIIMMYPSLRGGNSSPGHKERFLGEVDDVVAAGRYLATLDYVEPGRIYLGGHSAGGTLALLVAESTDQFRAVFALGPVGNMSGYEQKAVPFSLSDPTECRLRSPGLWLDSIRVRTFVFEGADAPCNIEQLRSMAAINRNPLVKFNGVPGRTHFSIIAPLIHDLAQQILSENGQ